MHQSFQLGPTMLLLWRGCGDGVRNGDVEILWDYLLVETSQCCSCTVVSARGLL